MMLNDHILTLSCPDRRGIVHRVTGLLLSHEGNIIDAQQFGDEETGRFFLRIHFQLPLGTSAEPLGQDFAAVASDFDMTWRIHDATRKARLAILVSRQGHCLNDLLFRVSSGQLAAEVVAVISNHPDFEPLVRSHGIAFKHMPVNADTKAAQEAAILSFVKANAIDLVVLARYMQILSPSLCETLSGRAINIHHSFLPSFKGARPYHQAHARGVKIIGATAHYVTPDLDEGPIIEQDVARVDHTLDPEDLTAVGRDVECVVLARAVKWHTEHRVLMNGHKTVVFR